MNRGPGLCARGGPIGLMGAMLPGMPTGGGESV